MEAMGAAGGQPAASPWAAMATGQFPFVCTCVHGYYNVCNISAMCAFTHLCAFAIPICGYAGLHMCVDVCVCIYIYMCVCFPFSFICADLVSSQLCVCVCVCVCVFVCMCSFSLSSLFLSPWYNPTVWAQNTKVLTLSFLFPVPLSLSLLSVFGCLSQCLFLSFLSHSLCLSLFSVSFSLSACLSVGLLFAPPPNTHTFSFSLTSCLTA